MKMKTTKRAKTQKRISEGLEFEDLKGLVKNTIMIDQHKPKIGDDEDTVVVAFDVTYEDPAKDLSNFIETGALEHLDVEVSGAPDQDGTWKVFVEFLRDNDLFEKIQAMLNSVDQITSREGDGWSYTAYGVDGEQKFNAKNFRRDIIDSRYEYRKKFIRGEKDEPVDELEESWLRRIRELQKLNA
jgi:hypothetical protein